MATPTVSNSMHTLPNSEANIMDNDPFAEISDAEYDMAATAYRFSGLPTSHAPLNPEQRQCGRDLVKIALIKREGKLQGHSPKAIGERIRRLGLHQITMMTGNT